MIFWRFSTFFSIFTLFIPFLAKLAKPAKPAKSRSERKQKKIPSHPSHSTRAGKFKSPKCSDPERLAFVSTIFWCDFLHFQVMVCGEEVGWRNDTRKVIVFTTDQSFHVAMVSCNVRHNFYFCKASQKYYCKNNNQGSCFLDEFCSRSWSFPFKINSRRNGWS